MRYTTIQPISMNSRLTINMRAYNAEDHSGYSESATKVTHLQAIHCGNQRNGNDGKWR